MKDFSYNANTQVVTATYKNPVSRVEDFVLEVGDKIMVENVAVGLGSTGFGYNSKGYDYNLFTITGVSTNLGGYPTITYSCLLYTSPSPRDATLARMPSSA